MQSTHTTTDSTSTTQRPNGGKGKGILAQTWEITVFIGRLPFRALHSAYKAFIWVLSSIRTLAMTIVKAILDKTLSIISSFNELALNISNFNQDMIKYFRDKIDPKQES